MARTKEKLIQPGPIVAAERSPTGIVLTAVPTQVPNGIAVATKLIEFSEEAAKAVEAATRTEVKDQESYNVATDVASSISAVLRQVEATRKSYSDPLEKAKKKLIELFAHPGDRLQSSLNVIKQKMSTWRTAEETRRRKEAADEQARIDAESKRLADAARAMGDSAGAQQIVEQAATIRVEPAKVTGSGTFGGAAVVQKRPVGAITDKREFLTWALTAAPEIIDAIDIAKTPLNNLARKLLEVSPAPLVPGFKYGLSETDTIR